MSMGLGLRAGSGRFQAGRWARVLLLRHTLHALSAPSAVRALSGALALSGAVALCAACAPQQPTVTPVAATVTAVGTAGLTLDVYLDVHNPNSFPLMAHRVEGAVLLGNGAELGRGAAQPPGSIPAKGSARIATRLDVPWLNVGALAPFAFSAQPVPYVFRGQATIGGESLNVKVPFEVTGTLTREQLIGVGLRGL
jgi:LEA14-like dessication related protein